MGLQPSYDVRILWVPLSPLSSLSPSPSSSRLSPASLAPFDGWAREYIEACQWKDYVFANEVPNDADW